MPNRILRDYTDSVAFEGISPEAERLWVRLLVKVDDFGRFHADPRLIRAACFPFSENLRSNDLARWLDELSRRQLLLRYKVSGREYLAVTKFRQRTRAVASKFPSPDDQPKDWCPPDPNHTAVECVTDDGHMTVNCQPDDSHPRTYSETETETETEARIAPAARSPASGDPSALSGQKETAKRFSPPTREELDLAAAKIGLPAIEVDKFVAYYGANGWRVGRSPMKSWTHALAGWAARWRERNHERKSANGNHRDNCGGQDDWLAQRAAETDLAGNDVPVA